MLTGTCGALYPILLLQVGPTSNTEQAAQGLIPSYSEYLAGQRIPIPSGLLVPHQATPL